MIGELIAKMEPHAVDPRQIPSTGQAELSAEDICAALGMIPGDGAPSLALRTKYGLENRAGRLLLNRIKGCLVTYDLDLEMQQRLSCAVLVAFVSPSLCFVCNGRKAILVNKLLVICESCGGTGIKSQSDFALMRQIGVKSSDWKHKFKSIFNTVLDTVQNWEAQGLSVLHRKIFRQF